MVLSITLLALSWVGQSPTISFSCRAEPLSHLVVDLGKATHLNLAVSKECANDVLIVSVQDVSVQKLLDEIAKVDAGEWRKDGETLKFSADARARRSELRAEVSKRASVIKAAILAQKAQVFKNQDQPGRNEDGSTTPSLTRFSTAEVNTVNHVLTGSATELTVLGLLEQLDPESLVLRHDQRLVFSTIPNRMQLEMSPGADAVIGDLAEQHNAAAKIIRLAIAERAKNFPTTGPQE